MKQSINVPKNGWGCAQNHETWGFLYNLRSFPKTRWIFLQNLRNLSPQKRLLLIRTVFDERGTPARIACTVFSVHRESTPPTPGLSCMRLQCRPTKTRVETSRHGHFLRSRPPSCASPRNQYKGTSLTKKRTPLGPYRRPMPRVLEGSRGDGRFLMGEEPL